MRKWLFSDKLSHNLIFLGVLAALPFVMQDLLGRTYLLGTEVLIFALTGLAFNMLLGYTGLLSFGHGMFIGMGAYTTALAQIYLMKDSLIGPVIMGVLAATLVGVVAGYLVMRKRGVYFSLLTLAFTQLFFYVCFRWTALTGGENGLSGITRPKSFLGMNLQNELVFYYLMVVVFVVCASLIRRLLDAPFGRVLQAIRDNELRASCIGYNPRRYKHLAFIVSAFFCGLAGSFYAFSIYFAYPQVFNVGFSGEIVAMTIVGGMRAFLGPVVGAAFFVVFKDILSSFTEQWMIFFGIIFMAFILFSPGGILGLAAKLMGRKRVEAGAAPALAASCDDPAEALDLQGSTGRDTEPTGEVIFEAQGITKRFGALVASNNVSFSVKKGELRALIGPNGAGKTTLFNQLTGVLPMDSGKVVFKGRDLTGHEPFDMARAGIARSFQITRVFKDLSVFENIRVAVQALSPWKFSLFADTSAITTLNDEADALVSRLGLSHLREHLAGNISHGDQRLLEIAITLATKPELIMLDEPLAGLASAERVKIARLIRSLSGRHTVILIDHDIDQVLAISDRITVLHQGTVIAEGTPDEVKANAEVQEAYIGGFHVKAAHAPKPVPAGEQPVLEVSGINTFYGKSHILHDVSLRVFKGELVCLLGRNGAGKTTTIHSIMGQTAPKTGDVHFLGQSIAREKAEVVARAGIELCPQGRRIFPNLSVLENLEIAFMQAKKSGRSLEWTPGRAIDMFPMLASRKASRGENLSGGELQMLAIARALMGNGHLLMLDEPFEGLAPTIVEGLWKVIGDLKSLGMTILLVEQNAEVALSLGDRAYVINNGCIQFEGAARDLTENLELRTRLLGV